MIADPAYLARLELADGRPRVCACEAWGKLSGGVLEDPAVPELHAPRALILERGTLAERLARALGAAPDRARLLDVYERPCVCVDGRKPFEELGKL